MTDEPQMTDDQDVSGVEAVVEEVSSTEVEFNDKLLALASHLGPFSGVGYFFIPLIIYLVKGDSDFVSRHAKQAMVYQAATGILMGLLGFAGFVLSFFTVGLAAIVVVPGMILVGLILSLPPLLAAFKAFNSEHYPYPGCGAWAEKLGSKT